MLSGWLLSMVTERSLQMPNQVNREGWDTIDLCYGKNLKQVALMHGNVAVVQVSKFCLPTLEIYSFLIPPSNATLLLNSTLYWWFDHVGHTVNDAVPFKKYSQHYLHIWTSLACFVFNIITMYPHMVYKTYSDVKTYVCNRTSVNIFFAQ